MMSLDLFFETHRNRFISVLEQILAKKPRLAGELFDSMAYTLLGGGKRLRPLLVYAVGQAFQANLADLDKIAASLEMIHIYSLIHDDLPALDNDDLRHGRPSCHIQFGEDIAIICGDALQSLAFEVLSQPLLKVDAERQIQLIQCLSKAIGDEGMAGGQILDLLAENKKINLTELETIHRLKTGALINAAIEMGAMAGNINTEELAKLKQFSHHMGLMFQIHDDVLDITSSTEKLGKPQGSDIANEKSTYPSLLGLDKAVELAWKHYHLALDLLNSIDHRDLSILKEITEFMIQRDH
jgi:farnesyl diphosphate synthase